MTGKAIFLLPVASSHEVELAQAGQVHKAAREPSRHQTHPSALPRDERNVAAPAAAPVPAGVDPLHLVLELQEQERRQREYEGRRLAARLQEQALKAEEDREAMEEHKGAASSAVRGSVDKDLHI